MYSPPVLEHVDNTDASLPLPQAALQSPDRAPSDAQRVAPLTNSIRLPPIIPPNDGGVAPHQNTSRGPSTGKFVLYIFPAFTNSLYVLGRLPSISNLTRFNTPGPLHNALSRENTFQSLATPQPGPPMSRSPPNSLHRFPPTTPQTHPRATSTSSVASGQPEEDIEGPAEPASLKMLERAVRGMDNLLANHEDYYNAIVKQRDLVRHARIRAQNARLLVLQEKSIHQRLSNYLSYFRPCSDSWTNRDVYGSKCRAKQLADGTYEEVDSDDEQREAEEKEYVFMFISTLPTEPPNYAPRLL